MEITTRNKITYALGGFGKNFAYGLVASYTLYYYNSVLGISASFVGVLLMVARIFDAFNDPLMGVVVAKTNTKYGKYKPWILTGAVLNAIVMFAMFTVPTALAGTGLKIYVTAAYFLCGITYTLSDIPYWSIIPAITKAGKGRESLTVFARTASAIGVAMPTIFTMFIIQNLFGNTKEGYRIGFSVWALVISIVYVVTTIITVVNLPHEEKSMEKTSSVKELLQALFKNDQALVLAIVIILLNAATTTTTSLALYMFDYETFMVNMKWFIIPHDMTYTLFMAINAIIQLLAMVVFYPMLRKKLSNRTIFMIAGLVGITGYLVLALYITGIAITFSMILLPCLCVSFANGTIYVQTTIFVAGAVDYGEAKLGRRDESIVSSLQTLMVKIGTAMSALVIGVGLDFVGIDENIIIQSHDTIVKLRFLYAVPPMLFIIIALIIFKLKKSIGQEAKIS